MENKKRQIIKQAAPNGVSMHWAVPALLLVWCVVSCSAVQIVEFCPDPYLHDDTDEYLVLSGTGSLDGIAVSDGKEGFRFSPAQPSVARSPSHGTRRLLKRPTGDCQTMNGMTPPRVCPMSYPAINSGWQMPATG